MNRPLAEKRFADLTQCAAVDTTGDAVPLECLAAGAGRGPQPLDGGKEILVLDGSFLAEGDRHPAGAAPAMASPEGCRYRVRRGHLPALGPAA